MSAIKNLPVFYQLASMLGARIEVFYEGEWKSIYDFFGLSSRTKYRVVAEDENVLDRVKKLIPDFYASMPFEGYEYYVPINALKPGTFIHMQYYLGVIIQIQEDGSYKKIEFDEYKKIADRKEQLLSTGISKSVFFGEED